MSTLNVQAVVDTEGRGEADVTFLAQLPVNAWSSYRQDITTTYNSSNVSGISDDAVGMTTVSYTNAFASAAAKYDKLEAVDSSGSPYIWNNTTSQVAGSASYVTGNIINELDTTDNGLAAVMGLLA